MVEHQILKLFTLDEGVYNKYHSYLKLDDFIKINYPMLFKLFKSLPASSLDSLKANYLSNYPVVKDGDRKALEELVTQINNVEVDETSIVHYLKSHRNRAIANEIGFVALDVAEGRKNSDELLPLFEKLQEDIIEEIDEDEFVTTDIEELVEEEDLEGGLNWSLDCLNRGVGPLRKGNLVHVFARVETGKTAFWINQVVHMAQQLKEDEHVVVFFNEEQGKDIIWRMYSCLTKWEYMQVVNNVKQAKQIWQEKIGNRIKFVDIPSKVSKISIESTLKKLNPKLVVIDNCDKVKGFNADRPDLVLHEIYKWVRELAKTYCPIISIGQADNTGHNTMWIDESQMANSKTGKPSEIDVAIGIGRVDKEGYEMVRYIYVSKNKLRGGKDTDESLRHGKFQVTLVPSLSTYEDF